MIPKIPAVLGLVGAVAVVGCLPNKKADIRQDDKVTQASYISTADPNPNAGRIIAPKRCGLSFANLSRPAKDPAINEILWQAADEQVVPAETIRTLAANGLRVGVMTGSLPVEIEKVLNPPPPGQKVDTVQIDLPEGDSTNVALCTATEPVTLLLNREGKTFGKDYQDAKGFLRITATHDGAGGVKLKIVPLIQHGPIKKGYAAAPTGPFQPQEFIMKDGQAEEPFRELTATVSLRPGQILAIGGRADAGLSLGGFLFTQAEPANDKVEQRVVLLWAQPAAAIPADEPPGRSFFRRGDKAKKTDAKAADNSRAMLEQMQANMIQKVQQDSQAQQAKATKP
jgi:hypothetical protein